MQVFPFFLNYAEQYVPGPIHLLQGIANNEGEIPAQLMHVTTDTQNFMTVQNASVYMSTHLVKQSLLCPPYPRPSARLRVAMQSDC